MKKVKLFPVLIGVFICLLLANASMAAPEKAVIYVDSNQNPAEIYLTNNTLLDEDNLTVLDTAGFTPREFFVEPGTYKLFVKKFGFDTWFTAPFPITAGSYSAYNATLNVSDVMYGALHIDSNPPGANLVLQRVIPNVTSEIYSATPASLESLPIGDYIINITKPGYHPFNVTAKVYRGEVTEISASLEPIVDSAIVTFKSDPSGARVFIYGGFVLNDEMRSNINKILSSQDKTAEEVSSEVNKIVSPDTIPPIKAVLGLVGTTPFDMELYEGEYSFEYFLDGYSNKWGYFKVIAGEKKIVSEKLDPDQEYVQVYFETNVDNIEVVDDEGNVTPGLKGALIYVNGELRVNKSTQEPIRTPCWVELNSSNYENVTFAQPPMFAPKSVNVDTVLFEGRPSKWSEDPIQLDLMKYHVQSFWDENSRVTPEHVEIEAGQSWPFELRTVDPKYVIHNFTVHRDGKDPILYPVFSNQSFVNYNHGKTLQNATLFLDSSIKLIEINATAHKGGTVNYPGVHYYPYEEESPEYNFTADEGYDFKEMYVDGKKYVNNPSYTFTSSQMRTDHIIEGYFRPNQILITPVASPGGKILDWDKGGEEATPYWIDYKGCTHEHEAVADPGYRYKYHSYNNSDLSALSTEDTGTRIGKNCDTFEENKTLNVYFEQLNYTINARVNDENRGMLNKPYTNYSAYYGENISIKATAFAGYQLSEFTDNGISKGAVNPYNITVTEDHDIVANFQSDVLTIEAVAGEGGIIEPEGIVNVTFGNSQCFNITANTNYFINSVVIDGEDTGNQTSPYQYCFNNVTKDHNISASFSRYAYTITPSAGLGGKISPSTPQEVPRGEAFTFTIIPDGCYTIKDVQIDGSSKGALSSYTFENVTEDHSIHADFQIKIFEILVNQSDGGVIDPAGDDGIVKVNCGGTKCFNITPDKGNAIYDVIVDNSSVGEDNQYCFTNITTNHTLDAVFVIPPVPEFESDRTRVPPKYPVTFKDFTLNNPTDWLWDFGDGEITTTREPVHYFAEVGNYTITLTAYNAAAPDGINNTKKHYIEVTKKPIAGFTADRIGGILRSDDVQIYFNDTSLNTDGVAFGWNFGDGPRGAISRNATHNYTAPGVYQVTHQVELPFIAKDYYYETITILQKPEAEFIAHPVSGEPPLTVQFEDRSQGFPTSWLWDFGDTVKSYDQNPVHVYSKSGSYTVSLSVFSDEGSSVKTKDGFITVQ